MIEKLTAESGPDCSQQSDLIQQTEESIASIESYLRGETDSWIGFDDTQLNDVPAECDLAAPIADLRQAKIDVVDSADFKLFQFYQSFSTN